MVAKLGKKTLWQKRLDFHESTRHIWEYHQVAAGRAYIQVPVDGDHFDVNALVYVQDVLISQVTSELRSVLNFPLAADEAKITSAERKVAAIQRINAFFIECRAAQHEGYGFFVKKYGIEDPLWDEKFANAMKSHKDSDKVPRLFYLHFQKIDAFDWLGKNDVRDAMLFKVLKPFVDDETLTEAEARDIWQACAAKIIANDVHNQAIRMIDSHPMMFALVFLVFAVCIASVMATTVSFGFCALGVAAILMGYRVFQWWLHHNEAYLQQHYQFPYELGKDVFGALGSPELSLSKDFVNPGTNFSYLWKDGKDVNLNKNSDKSAHDEQSSLVLGAMNQSSGS